MTEPWQTYHGVFVTVQSPEGVCCTGLATSRPNADTRAAVPGVLADRACSAPRFHR